MIVKRSHEQLNELLSEPVNFDLQQRVKYFSTNYMAGSISYLVLLENKKICGLLAYQQSYNYMKCYHIEYISLDKDYMGLSYASQMLDIFCQLAQGEKQAIAVGSLSPDGKSKIFPKLIKLTNLYKIELKIV